MSFWGNSWARMEAMAAGEYEPAPLVETGIHALDRALRGGIPRNKITVIAGRVSHGKTATAVRLAVNVALSGRRVLVIWCEDEEVEFDLRAWSLLSGTPFTSLLQEHREKRLGPIMVRVPSWKRNRWQQNATTARIERPKPEELADMLRSYKPEVAIVDHLGEVDWGPGKKHEAIGDGLRLVRNAALETKTLFVGMAQLNRDWDRRKAVSPNPERVAPCLSDIENSGQIEQVARVCVILEKVYGKEGEEKVPTGEYRYHVFKPFESLATCRWHETTATPGNAEGESESPPQLEVQFTNDAKEPPQGEELA